MHRNMRTASQLAEVEAGAAGAAPAARPGCGCGGTAARSCRPRRAARPSPPCQRAGCRPGGILSDSRAFCALAALCVRTEQAHHRGFELVGRLNLLHSQADVELHLPAWRQATRRQRGRSEVSRRRDGAGSAGGWRGAARCRPQAIQARACGLRSTSPDAVASLGERAPLPRQILLQRRLALAQALPLQGQRLAVAPQLRQQRLHALRRRAPRNGSTACGSTAARIRRHAVAPATAARPAGAACLPHAGLRTPRPRSPPACPECPPAGAPLGPAVPAARRCCTPAQT